MHLDLFRTLPLTMFTSPALDVKAEPARLVTAYLRLSCHGKELPDQIEHTGVSCRVASRRSADRRLIDLDDLIDVRNADDRFMFARPLPRIVDPALQTFKQYLGHQGALTRARYPRYAGKDPDGKFDADAL